VEVEDETETEKSLMITSALLLIGSAASAGDNVDSLAASRPQACIASGGDVASSWAYNDGGVRWGRTVSCVKVGDAGNDATDLASRRSRMARLCTDAGGRFEQSWAYDDGGTQWGETASCSTGSGTVVCRGMSCGPVERWAAAPRIEPTIMDGRARKLASALSTVK